MNPIAVAQSKQRLEKASLALNALKSTSTFEGMEDAWSDILMYCGTIFNKLEQGAKVTSKSKAWFGRVKHKRRKDELLTYMWQARNSDEHGIEKITERMIEYKFPNEPTAEFPFVSISLQAEHNDLCDKEFQLINELGEKQSIQIEPQPIATLIPVKNTQFGDIFPIPKSHLGENIQLVNAINIATLYLKYMEALIGEAASLAQ